METIGEMLIYLSRFPRNWKVFVTRSDEGGELIPYLEGQDSNEIVLTTKGD